MCLIYRHRYKDSLQLHFTKLTHRSKVNNTEAYLCRFIGLFSFLVDMRHFLELYEVTYKQTRFSVFSHTSSTPKRSDLKNFLKQKKPKGPEWENKK